MICPWVEPEVVRYDAPARLARHIQIGCGAARHEDFAAPPGKINANPQNVIAQGTDWRFLSELKRESGEGEPGQWIYATSASEEI